MKKIFTHCLLSLATLPSFAATPIEDGPGAPPKQIILFAGSSEIQVMHKGVIQRLPETQFTVFLGDGVKDIPAYHADNVKLVQLQTPITSWSQDRLVRFKSDEGPVLTSIYADHLMDSTASPYELMVPKIMHDTNGTETFDGNIEKAISSPGGKEVHIVPVADYNTHWRKGYVWPGMVGDGGDRLVTKKNVFIGKSTVAKNSSDLSQLFGRPVVGLDAEREGDRYLFHIDMFVTPVSDTVVIFGSVSKALEVFGEAPWLNLEKMHRLATREALIKQQLTDAGYTAIDVPLFYTEKQGLVSFNNGIFDGKTFLSVDYDIPEISGAIKESKSYMKAAMNTVGLTVTFIPGGEQNIQFGGQLRCSTAVIF